MKLRSLMLFIAASIFLTSPVYARHHVAAQVAAEGCNILWPCEGVIKSVRGERVVKAMGGLGIARPQYAPHAIQRASRADSGVIGGRPGGCPYQFCGCSASLYLFGKIVPSLNLAANWLRFPRATPAPGMAAARNHHVMVLVSHVQGDVWVVHDGNSGGHQTRVHERSIAGYVIVNPHA